MNKAAKDYFAITEELSLPKLALTLKYMAESVDKTLGKDNKILYIQFYKELDMALKETRLALQQFEQDHKEKLVPNAEDPDSAKLEAIQEEVFVVPDRKDSCDKKKPARRLSDVDRKQMPVEPL